MRIKTLIIILMATITVHAQDAERMGMISLVPYIPEDTEISGEARAYLIDKLSQIATVGGLSGQGVDNRFVITANIRELKKTVTATSPQKTAMRISVSLYIGDGIDGTLFASANKEVTGIGSNAEDAYISAIRKIPARDPAIVQCINEGKARIIEYYDNMSGSIINSAKTSAASGDYQGAINKLFSIPMQCRRYNEAQQLVAEIYSKQVENDNQTLLANARSAWGASPDREGAEKAWEFLSGIQFPSSTVSSEVKKLSAEMSARLSEKDNQEWKMEMQESQNRHKAEMQEAQNRHDEEMAQIQSHKERSIALINAAASVARVRAANRPRVIYRIYHWW